MKFGVYADIHYDRVSAGCVTVDDCERVEKSFFDAAESWDFTIFAGDRFLRREPEDEVKTRADRILIECVKKPHFMLVGNHDWTTNAMRWHTGNALGKLGLENLIIMDEAKTYRRLFGSQLVSIHALPAGMKFDFSKYAIYPGLNIFVFHDIVRGSFMAENSDRVFDHGLELVDLDRPEFDFVFGGDIHVPQKFGLRHTVGGYVGSVLQRTRADADSKRGWLEIDGTVQKFVGVPGLFTKQTIEVDAKTKFEKLKLRTDVADTLFEVKLVGEKKDVDRIADDLRWLEITNVRKLEILREYQGDVSETVIDMSRTSSPAEDLALYLDSGFGELGAVNKDKVFNLVGGV